MGYNQTLQGYLSAMRTNPEQVNDINPSALDELQKIQLRASSQQRQANTATQEESHQSDKSWWSQVSDFFTSINDNIFKGVYNFFDGIGDAVMGVVGSIGGAVGNTELQNAMEDAINYDWQSKATRLTTRIIPTQWAWDAINASSNGEDFQLNGDYFLGNDNWIQEETRGNFGMSDEVADTIGSVEQGIGQMLPSLAIGNAVGGAVSTGSTALSGIDSVGTALSTAGNITGQVANIATQASLGFAQGVGRGYSKAVSDGAGLNGASTGYAMIQGLIQGVEQGVSAGVGGTFGNKAQNLLGSKVATSVFGKTGSETLANVFGNITSVITDIGMDTAINVLEDAVDPAIQMIYNPNAWNEAYGSEEARKETWTNIGVHALTSALTSAVVNTAKSVANPSSNKDFIGEKKQEIATELANNEAFTELDAERTQIENQIKGIEEIKNETLNQLSAEDIDAETKKALTESMKTYNESERTLAQQLAEKSKAQLEIVQSAVKSGLGTTGNVASDANVHQLNLEGLYDAKTGKIKGGNQYRNVNGYEVRYDAKSNTLQYRANDASAFSDSLNAISAHKGDSLKVNANVLGIEGNSDVRIDNDGSVDVKAVNAIINDTENIRTIYRNGKDTYVENSKGAGFLIEDGKMTSISNEKPSWATDDTKVRFTENINIYNAPSSLKKDASYINITSTSTAKEGLGTFLQQVIDRSTASVAKVTSTDGQDPSKVLADKWTLAKTQAERDLILENVKDIQVRYIGLADDGKTLKYVTSRIADLPGFGEDYMATLKKDLGDYLDANATYNEKQKLTIEYQNKIAKLESDIALMQNDFDTKARGAKEIERWKKLLSKEKQPSTASGPYKNDGLNPYARQWATNLEFSGKDLGVSAKRMFKALTGDIEYNADTIGQYSYNSQVKDLIDEIRSHYDDNGDYFGSDDHSGKALDKLTTQDIETMTGVLAELRMEGYEEYRLRNAEIRKNSIALSQAIKGLSKAGVNAKGLGSSTTGMLFRLGELLGRDSKAYQFFVTNAIDDHNKSAIQKASFISEMNGYLEENGLKAEDITSKKIQVNGIKEKLTKGQVMQMYINMLSTENKSLMEYRGVNFSTGTGKKDTGNYFLGRDFQVSDIENALSDNEKKFAVQLFKNSYNGSTQKVLSDYALNKYGYNPFQSTGDYVHLTRSGLNYVVEQDNNFNNIRKSLGNNISKSRVNTSASLRMDDILVSFANYAQQVSDFVSMDNVRDIDRAVNFKDSGDEFHIDTDGNLASDNGQNVMQRFSQVNGGELFQRYMDSINNVKPKQQGAGMVLYSNAVLTPLELNIGTMLKMSLDPIRLAPNVGWGNIFKGYIKGMASIFTPNSNKVALDYFKENSGFYNKANADKYYISSNVFADNLGKVQRFLSKGLEASSNFMMERIAFPMFQERVATDYGYAIGSAENTAKATEMFDTYALTSLSNGDAMDISDLRAGTAKGGQLTRAIFGLFGGDNQKKAENFAEAFLGNKRSKERVNAINQQLNGENGIEKDLQQQNERIEIAQSKLDDLENPPTERQRRKLELEIEERKMTIEGLEASKADMQNQLKVEQEYQSSPKVMARVGNFAGVFILSAIAEQAINLLNNELKGKRLDEEDMEEQLTDLGFDMFVSWIPYVGTISSAVRYNSSLSALPVEGINSLVTTLSDAWALKDGVTESKAKNLAWDTAYMTGNLLGLPVKNFENYLNGALKNIQEIGNATGNESTYYQQYITIMKGYNSSYLKKQSQQALKSGNLTKATENTMASLQLFKTGDASWKVAKEITKLSAVPRDIPSELNQGQKEKFMSVYSKSNKAIENVISTKKYNSLTSEDKASMITKAYNAYYDVANYIATGDEPTSTLGKALYNYLYNSKALTEKQISALKDAGLWR